MKKTLHLFIAFIGLAILPNHVTAQSGIITTVVGAGTHAYSGDGGPATAAEITNPFNLTFDAAGNMYFADYDNNRVRKVSTSGVITTVAGVGPMYFGSYGGDGGPATDAHLYRPLSVAVDAAGNIYIADNGNNRVRKVNTSGIITTIAGTGVAAYGSEGTPATATPLNSVTDVHIDAAGNLYLVDGGNYRIRKIDPAGIITTVAGAGSYGYSGDGGPATAAQFEVPTCIAFDMAGNMFVSEYGNRIRKINAAGIISTVAGDGTMTYGGDGGLATAAKVARPWGLATDAGGNLYIADRINNRIRMINTAGFISTVAGNSTMGYCCDGMPATAASLYGMTGVAFDAAGNMYIGDIGNSRIRKVTASNNSPYFTGGHNQNLTLCQNASAVSINALLAINDADVAQTETWSVVMAPAHGTVAAAYTAVSTGSTIVPTGLTYTPASGYSGTDSFSVQINDGTATDVTTIHVTVNPTPAAITGPSTVCVGATITLSSATAGTWASSNGNATIGLTSGVVTGVMPGSAVITHRATTGCYITRTVNVTLCPTGVAEMVNRNFKIYPNPAADVLTVESAGSIDAVSIINPLGQILINETFYATKAEVNISSLPAGIYLLKVNGYPAERFVKE